MSRSDEFTPRKPQVARALLAGRVCDGGEKGVCLPPANRLKPPRRGPSSHPQDAQCAKHVHSLERTVEAHLNRLLKIPAALKRRASQIRVLLMDVDGTMTDGSVTLLSQPDGTALEIKTFDAHDGQGLTLAQTAGLRTGCITGRESSALLRRAQEMKMEFIYMTQALKTPAYEDVLRKSGVSELEVAFIGDDLPDIPLLRRAGLAVAVGNAAPEVKKIAHYTTEALAGHGAIRETVELILRSKGIWADMIDKARA